MFNTPIVTAIFLCKTFYVKNVNLRKALCQNIPTGD